MGADIPLRQDLQGGGVIACRVMQDQIANTTVLTLSAVAVVEFKGPLLPQAASNAVRLITPMRRARERALMSTARQEQEDAGGFVQSRRLTLTPLLYRGGLDQLTRAGQVTSQA